MEPGERPATAGFGRLEAAQALIDRGDDPREACPAAGLDTVLYGDEIRRAIDAAVRIYDAPASLVGELVDVYTLRFALESLEWRPADRDPNGDWHRPDPEEPWIARLRVHDPTGSLWEFVVDTSDLYEQILSIRSDAG